MIRITVHVDGELCGSAQFTEDVVEEDLEYLLREGLITAAGECFRNTMYSWLGQDAYNLELFDGELLGDR